MQLSVYHLRSTLALCLSFLRTECFGSSLYIWTKKIVSWESVPIVRCIIATKLNPNPFVVTWLFFFLNFNSTYLQHGLRSTWTVHFLTELWWVWSLVNGFLAFSWQALFRRCYFLRLMGGQSRSHSSCRIMSDSGWWHDHQHPGPCKFSFLFP